MKNAKCFKLFAVLYIGLILICSAAHLKSQETKKFHRQNLQSTNIDKLESQTRKIKINHAETFDFGRQIASYAVGFLELNYKLKEPSNVTNLRLSLNRRKISNSKIVITVNGNMCEMGFGDLDPDKSFVTVTVIAYLSESIDNDVFLTTQTVQDGIPEAPIQNHTGKAMLLYPFISGFDLKFKDGKANNIRSFSISTDAQNLPGNHEIQLFGYATINSDDLIPSTGTLDIGLLALPRDRTVVNQEVKSIYNSKTPQFVSFSNDVKEATMVLQFFSLVFAKNSPPRGYSILSVHLGGKSLPAISGNTVTIPDYESYMSSSVSSVLNNSIGLVIATF